MLLERKRSKLTGWRHGDMETWGHGDMETWRHTYIAYSTRSFEFDEVIN